jgi:hypothetical protein
LVFKYSRILVQVPPDACSNNPGFSFKCFGFRVQVWPDYAVGYYPLQITHKHNQRLTSSSGCLVTAAKLLSFPAYYYSHAYPPGKTFVAKPGQESPSPAHKRFFKQKTVLFCPTIRLIKNTSRNGTKTPIAIPLCKQQQLPATSKYRGSRARSKGRKAAALRSGPTALFPVEPRGLRQGHNRRQTITVSPYGKTYTFPAPAFPLNPTTNPARFFPKTAVPPSGERRRLLLCVALPLPRPHFPAPSGAYIRRYSNSGRTLQRSASGSVPGQAPYSAFSLPKQSKQAAEHTAPPPTLHFRISPAYRYIYPHYEAPWGA